MKSAVRCAGHLAARLDAEVEANLSAPVFLSAALNMALTSLHIQRCVYQEGAFLP
jgi:hypothetical protein